MSENLTAADKEKLMSQRKGHLLSLLRMDAPDFLIITHAWLLIRGYCGEDTEKATKLIREKLSNDNHGSCK